MRIFIFISLLIVTLAAGAETLRGRVTWVIDGDTVTLNASNGVWFTVRLWGIDAPESDQPGGRAATLALVRLVGRKQVTVEIKDRDRYGRIVGVIVRGKEDVNRVLLANGHAWYYERYAPKAKSYAEAEATARKERRGIWAESDPVAPWEWRKRAKAEENTSL